MPILCRHLTEQLQKVQIVNDINKGLVIEALRSIAELITYGDQHDSNFFEFFIEKKVMGEFVRILQISRTVTVSLQLLQTLSIMIQNLKSEHAIYYMLSNEHINFLITYKFDFHNEELLSYYISLLRAISGKLNNNTISLLVQTQNEEVISFPLYVEAIKFAFHEENMIRTAVRALTLNVYHVGDELVNRFVTKDPHADYFSNLLRFFQKQCIDLSGLVSEMLKNPELDATTSVLAAVDEIEDNLYYFSDVISAGIPDVGRFITDNILQLLILPLLLPSLQHQTVEEKQICAIAALYLLCCILRIVKIKDLANTVAAALFFPPESFIPKSEAKPNGNTNDHNVLHERQHPENDGITESDGHVDVTVRNLSGFKRIHLEEATVRNDCSSPHWALRDALFSYIACGDDLEVLGALSVLATLLQTKELDEAMLDALGILPQQKQHKKLLLQALVGEGSAEDQLFSCESVPIRDSIGSELDGYMQKLKDKYGVVCASPELGTSPRVHRFQVLDALISLFARSNISAETLWDGGWLLRQLLPYSEAEFKSQHLKLFRDSYKTCVSALLEQCRGTWPDLLTGVLCEEWKKCRRVIEASSSQKEPKNILLPIRKAYSGDVLPSESSVTAGHRMCELVKMFVLLHQLQAFFHGKALPEDPTISFPTTFPENSRARTAGLDISGPKPGTELRIVDAMPCRIAFERGKERHFSFLAISMGTSGWILLAEELPLKRHYGIVRVAAPLAGSNPKIDDKHSKWLHLRIRPFALPVSDPAKSFTSREAKTKALVDGRWTLAFWDEESCRSALSMVLEEINHQSNEVERQLKQLVELAGDVDDLSSSLHPSNASSSSETSLDSFISS